jgi:hypothetical protein
MSSDIWMRCGGRSSRCSLDARPWRVVEDQSRSSTRKLVDSDEEHTALEELIDAANPRPPADPAFSGLHWLLCTAFRYPPLPHGSRFSTSMEPSLWYGSEELRTALAEDAYYRLFVNQGSKARLTPFTVSRATFQAHVRTANGADLSRGAFTAHKTALCSPSDYTATQAVGARMRADGIEAFRFASARDMTRGMNIGVFSPRAFASRKPLNTPMTWRCTVTDTGVAYDHTIATPQSFHFPKTDFLVGGELPMPAA